MLTTGFDAPHIDCVVLLRPTLSPGLYYQMVGRGFRLHPGKMNCLVLDFGGNVVRHGPVAQTLPADDGNRFGRRDWRAAGQGIGKRHHDAGRRCLRRHREGLDRGLVCAGPSAVVPHRPFDLLERLIAVVEGDGRQAGRLGADLLIL